MDSEKNIVPQYIPIEKLVSLVPHKGKMLLLSRITAHDCKRNCITTEYDVTKNCILYNEELGGIPAWASFEMMAQSISALSTLCNMEYESSDSVTPGVILSVSNYNSTVTSIEEGTTVELRVCGDCRLDDVCRYDGELYIKNSDVPLVMTKITVMGINDMRSLCN